MKRVYRPIGLSFVRLLKIKSQVVRGNSSPRIDK